MMDQFRAERNQYGNLRIFCRMLVGPHMLWREVCLRQFCRETGEWK